jgi:DNA polymerase (family 10)
MQKIRTLNKQFDGSFRLLMGAEVDILNDGAMDYPNEVLVDLDFVIGSVHTGFTQAEAVITRRIVRAMDNPYLTLLAHPTGRLMGQREPYAVNLETVFKAAQATGTAVEINAYPKRLDLCDTAARRARALGVTLAISTDSHSLDQLDQMTFGLGVARRAWLEPRHLLNCFSLEQLSAWIARKRRRADRRAL